MDEFTCLFSKDSSKLAERPYVRMMWKTLTSDDLALTMR